MFDFITLDVFRENRARREAIDDRLRRDALARRRREQLHRLVEARTRRAVALTHGPPDPRDGGRPGTRLPLRPTPPLRPMPHPPARPRPRPRPLPPHRSPRSGAVHRA